MEDNTPTKNRSKGEDRRTRRLRVPVQGRPTTNKNEEARLQEIFDAAEFPPLPSLMSQHSTNSAEVLNQIPPTASNVNQQSILESRSNIHGWSRSNKITNYKIEPLMPLMPVTVSKSTANVPYTTQGTPAPQSIRDTSNSSADRSRITTKNVMKTNLRPPSANHSKAALGNNMQVSPPQTLTPRENAIYQKLCEIILTMHKSKEYVCRERVQQELLRFYCVQNWHDLRVQPAKFDALINLTDRQKSVTFYLRVFEQTFNLCTIHDIGLLIARFMKVEKYDDLRLGPIEKNPEVRQIFGYQPVDCDQPSPVITTGEIISKFYIFQKNSHGRRTTLDMFLDFLIEEYELQSREELGLFCRSYPYLIEVAGKVRRDLGFHTQEIVKQLGDNIIEELDKKVVELKEIMRDELQLSSFHKKKTPIDVLIYLISIVQNYLNFIPQQGILYTVLLQLRDNEYLRCLLNLSIYLGTLENPNVYVEELKKLVEHQESNSRTQNAMMSQLNSLAPERMSKKDRKIFNKMLLEQQQSKLPHSTVNTNERMTRAPGTVEAISTNPSFSSLFLASYNQTPKISVSFKQLCSDIYGYLIHYDTPLTIEQLLKVDEDVCRQYGVNSFFTLTFNDYNDYNNDNNPDSLLSFLETYRNEIDPNGELSVYEDIQSPNNQIQLYSFVHQLTMMNSNERNETSRVQQVELTHGYINAEQLHINDEELSTIEKAAKHKFGGSSNFRIGKQLIKKVKRRFHKDKNTIIRFEESILDLNGLNELNTCPISLNINENQLWELILYSPLMINLHTWLHWLNFFQPKYGTLQAFIGKHENECKNLQLLEISTGELYRLPIDTTLTIFEDELNAMHVRSAVGHLCSRIIQEGQIKRFPINVYRTSMDAWFRHLRSAATLQHDHIDPLQRILEFLMYLPIVIGQSRIIEELILTPLDKLFDDPSDNIINPRTKLWNVANAQQRIKLEVWGYTLNIDEWKNEKKWMDNSESEEKSMDKLENQPIQQQISNTVNSIMTTTITEPVPVVTTKTTSEISVPTKTTNINAENDSAIAAFQHVESIRRGFGVDNNLDAASQAIITNLLGMVDRSLKRLSTDLYVEQGHFVLELIQNADDNQYAQDVTPTLRFNLSSERILVCNNEIGFLPDNITAISNVGASTKGKHKQGYTGHKGIGFKSVFVVSHRPEIHSRNYHICFDTGDGSDQIGYALPIWLDKYDEVLPSADEWMTCLRLPIKEDAQDARIKENFNKIESIFLLFLNRLRKIEIINQYDVAVTNHISRIFTRIDHVQGQIIELQEQTTKGVTISNLWLVVKKVIEVPDDIKKKLRDVKTDVNTTIIAIAYPINSIQDSSSFNPPTRPVFAYLPLCSYGFRFILQADFEVPANRQEILHDNLWNEWLKSEMACLISLAYSQFQHLANLVVSSSFYEQIQNGLTPLKIIKFFLKFFPTHNESKPFFNKFVDTSIQLLMGIIKLPVSYKDDNGETVINWVSPSQCVILHDQFIRKILSQDLLLSHFNSYYVHEELVQECDEQILLKLGCRQLDFSDITKLIELSYKQNEQQHLKTATAIEQIAQWLACLDYSIQQQREEMNYKEREKDIIAKLRKLKIIPLRNYTHLVSVEEFDNHAISFPLDKATQYSKHLRLVLEDLPTIDEQLINFIDDKYPRRVDSIHRLLLNLGISRGAHNIRVIYHKHMLPIMSDETRWSSKSESVLIAYLICIYGYLYLPDMKQFENELQTLRKNMVIKTHTNKLVSLGSPDVVVHLTTKYGAKNSLETLNLSNNEFLFISDDYLHEFYNTSLYNNPSDLDMFARFFKNLKISDYLSVIKNETEFGKVAELENTKWAHLIDSLCQMVFQPFIISDYSCDEFNKLVTPSNRHQKVNVELCVKLLQHIESCYQHYSDYYAASVMLLRSHKFGHYTPIKGIESSFYQSLRQHAWIPVDGDILLKPTEVYLISQQHPTSPFRRYVPHIKIQLKNEEFIYNILGIRPKIEPRTMFDLLMKWSCGLDSNSLCDLINQSDASNIIPCTLPKEFHQPCLDSINNFRLIYTFLASDDITRHLLGRFSLWPIVFIPRNEKTGEFVFVEQIFWRDPAFLLSTQDTIADSAGRIPIQSYYDDDTILYSLFIDILHVELNPRIDDYLPLLLNHQDTNKIWKIIEIITQLAIEQNKQAEVRDKCRNIAFIPCIDNKPKLVKYTDRPYYPHDDEIANLFSDILSIIKLPDYKISTTIQEQFRSIFNIDLLNKVVQTRVNVENEQPSTSLLHFYSSCIDLIQNFLLNKQLISSEQSIYLSSIFARMHFSCVSLIDLSYWLNNDINRSASKQNVRDTFVDEQSGKFYILKKYEHSEVRFIDAMVEFIVKDETSQRDLSHYLQKLLKKYQDEGENGLNKFRENLIDNNEPKWTIPKVVEHIVNTLPPTPIKREQPRIAENEIEQLKNEPRIRPKTVPKPVPTEEENKEQTCFPHIVRATETSEKHTSHAPKQPMASDSKIDEDTSSKQTSNHKNHNQHEKEQSITADTTKQHEKKSSNEQESNNNETISTGSHYRQPQVPVVFSDSVVSDPNEFKCVTVSTLTNIDINNLATTDASTDTNIAHPTPNEADRQTGRLGEQLVFYYLKSQYPNADVKWINEDKEYGSPYDIHLIFKSEENREEFIEVKTTRSDEKYSFPVSIGEIKYLLDHPSNYYIYRVYYADNIGSSTITIMNQIKSNLEQKCLKLLMTYNTNFKE